MNTLPLERDVLLDKNFKFRKCYNCGDRGSIHFETFAIFDKDALKYIQILIDNELDNKIKEHMQGIYCLQMFCYEVEGTEHEKIAKVKAFTKITQELDKHSTNGYVSNDKALWWQSYVIVQKEDMEVMSIPAKFKSTALVLQQAWRGIAGDSL